MSVNKLSIGGNLPLRVFYQDSTGPSNKLQFGLRSIPELSISLEYGTGSGQANKAYAFSRTLTATTMDSIDLAGSLSDGVGNTITFTSIKLAIVAIVTPTGGTKKLRVGPQNQTNALSSNWGSLVVATVYKEFTHWDTVIYEPVAGYTVTAGTADIFPIYNPSASSITYELLLAGV